MLLTVGCTARATFLQRRAPHTRACLSKQMALSQDGDPKPGETTHQEAPWATCVARPSMLLAETSSKDLGKKSFCNQGCAALSSHSLADAPSNEKQHSLSAHYHQHHTGCSAQGTSEGASASPSSSTCRLFSTDRSRLQLPSLPSWSSPSLPSWSSRQAPPWSYQLQSSPGFRASLQHRNYCLWRSCSRASSS